MLSDTIAQIIKSEHKRITKKSVRISYRRMRKCWTSRRNAFNHGKKNPYAKNWSMTSYQVDGREKASGPATGVQLPMMFSPTDCEAHRTSHSRRHEMLTWNPRKSRRCGRFWHCAGQYASLRNLHETYNQASLSVIQGWQLVDLAPILALWRTSVVLLLLHRTEPHGFQRGYHVSLDLARRRYIYLWTGQKVTNQRSVMTYQSVACYLHTGGTVTARNSW